MKTLKLRGKLKKYVIIKKRGKAMNNKEGWHNQFIKAIGVNIWAPEWYLSAMIYPLTYYCVTATLKGLKLPEMHVQ